MGCNYTVPIGDVISFSRGGGWGKDSEGRGLIRVAVVRGADFPRIARGAYDSLVIRFEKESKVESVSLQVGDIVLENSGGTDSRPTGRTVLITQELLDTYDCPVIPASFCRLLRFSEKIDSSFVYYWLQDMYMKGRTWGYQNRSTGLSNFQFKVFAQEERVPILPLDLQKRIAFILSSLDAKVMLNNRLNDYLAA